MKKLIHGKEELVSSLRIATTVVDTEADKVRLFLVRGQADSRQQYLELLAWRFCAQCRSTTVGKEYD